MIPWEVSMTFEQFTPLFQILQIMENTMLAVIICQPTAQLFAKI
jgi:ABC-type polar amino acid transport system ATPase subunit